MSKHRIAVFKSGSEPSSDGRVFSFTENDLREIASSYDPEKHECPIVIGHPDDKAPAWGWAERFEVDGNILYMIAKNVDPDFAEMVNKGLYKKRSLSLYPPDSKNNPVPGAWYPRHVAWLGAQPPSKKGLPDYNFNDSSECAICVQYEEKEMPPEEDKTEKTAPPNPFVKKESNDDDEIAKLKKELEKLKAENAEYEEKAKKQKKASDADFAESLIKSGKLLPSERTPLLEILETVDGAKPVSFGEEKISTRAFLNQVLNRLPNAVEYSEIAGDSADFGEGKTPPKDPFETAIDHRFPAKKGA